MSLVEYARSELERAKLFDKNSDYNGMMGKAVMELIETFHKQGHSGVSAEICLSVFDKLSRFKPLTPLTSDPKEWNEVSENMLQSKRCPYIFWNIEEDHPYTIEDYIFIDSDGCAFTCNGYGRTHFELPGFPPETVKIVKNSEEHKKFMEEHNGFNPFKE